MSRQLTRLLEFIDPTPPVSSRVAEDDFLRDDALWPVPDTDRFAPLPLEHAWNRGWNSGAVTLRQLHEGVLRYRPKVIFETGTLSAHATMAMALAAEKNGGAIIHTVDYDGDPLQSERDISREEWTELAKGRARNIAAIARHTPHCDIAFHSGDSRKVLPGLLTSVGRWDFWFQDSMHFKSGIIQELEIMLPKSAAGSVIVFDNVDIQHPFGRWFARSHGRNGWIYRSWRDGRDRQLWARRIA